MNCIQLKKQLRLFFPCDGVNGAHEKQNCVQTKESGFLSSPHPSIEQNSNCHASASTTLVANLRQANEAVEKHCPLVKFTKLRLGSSRFGKKWCSSFKCFVLKHLLLLLNRARRNVFGTLFFSEKGSCQIPLGEEELSTFISDTAQNTSIIVS